MRRSAVYVGNDRVLLRTAAGYKMYADARDVSITPHLILDGVYERHTESALRTLVKPGMRILEIGANIGLFTVLMAHRTGTRGFVRAFECDPMLAQIARDNLEINGLSEIGRIDERAVTNATATLRFFTARRHRGGGTLVEGLEQLPGLAEERGELEVQSTTVDAIVAEEAGAFDFVKIDAEGAETAIFRGGRSVFADRGRPLIVMTEFSPAFIAKSGDDPARHLAELESFGFSLRLIDERRRKLVPIDRDALLARPFSDLVLIRREQRR